jgi:choline dehydrogenase-like flavoprotein
MADFLFVLRDHGGGQVTIDDAGEAVHTYALTDERDVAAYRLGLRVMARLHEAAGAEELWFGTTPRVWRAGEDLEAWVDELDQVHIGADGLFMGSAHQMGSARMGTDPATSVARPTGELHDVDGVWIGDTSAFPTASGANPMLTCMALAHRTARSSAARATSAGRRPTPRPRPPSTTPPRRRSPHGAHARPHLRRRGLGSPPPAPARCR